VHTEAVRTTCQRLGAGFRTLGTDRPLELAMFDFLRERMQRGKAVSRVTGMRKAA